MAGPIAGPARGFCLVVLVIATEAWAALFVIAAAAASCIRLTLATRAARRCLATRAALT